MTAEEIFIKLRDELTADNESSSSPERIFIKSEGQTICTLGMNRSHEIIFVEFKPTPKDLTLIEREPFVHPHPVEMLHDAGWRQAQLTSWEEAEKLLEIIQRSYKKKKPKPAEIPASAVRARREAALARRAARKAKEARKRAEMEKARMPAKPAVEKAVKAPKPKAVAKPKAKAKSQSKIKAKAKPKKPAAKKSKAAKTKKKKR